MLRFYKYQGAGNDFIVFDNMEGQIPLPKKETIIKYCDRKFGIGADGMIFLLGSENYDFEMLFFNPDGSQSLCGNGCRCAVAFAKRLGLINSKTSFKAIDGAHEAEFVDENVKLLMNDVKSYEKIGKDLLIDTGSPHYIRFINNVDDLNLVEEARRIRYNDRFKEKGVNVNFVEQSDAGIRIRTYERGVENETLSCGTGVTAAALANYIIGGLQNKIDVFAKGGNLKVEFHPNEDGSFSAINLIGPAKFVFKGEINEWV